VIGCTSYHDILAPVARLEIGFTWYAKSYQRTHVNTACKLMLLKHAFETLGAALWAGEPIISITPHDARLKD